MPAGQTTIPTATLANGSIMSALGSPLSFGLPGYVPASWDWRECQQAGKLSRWPMTWTWTPLMIGLAVACGFFAIGLVILLIYRSTLTMHEDEALYLDDASAHMQKEQTELITKVNRLTIPVWVFGAGFGVFLLVLAGMFIYQGLNAVQ